MTGCGRYPEPPFLISIHIPYKGYDLAAMEKYGVKSFISIHIPYKGYDRFTVNDYRSYFDFNPHTL